jgi:hypothetical protein
VTPQKSSRHRRRVVVLGILLAGAVLTLRIYHIPGAAWGVAFISPITTNLCTTSGNFTRAVEVVSRFGCNFYPSPHAMGCGRRLSVRYDPGLFSFSREVLPTGDDDGQIKGYFLNRDETPQAICTQSKIIDDTVYVYPVGSGFGEAVVVSEDGGQTFEFRPTAGHYSDSPTPPPNVVDRDNYLLGTAWQNHDIVFLSAQQIELTQEKHLQIKENYSSCPNPGCPLFISRRVVSADAGLTWKLVNFEIVRPDLIPKGGRVILKSVRAEIDSKRDLYDEQGRPQSIVKLVKELSE